ncbi:beta-glucosidase [Streptosporangiaceae bacterium NEAU-GS5]|nr:beta-glucosidase [Streptosporangiaceae bacterium NEAU-GS5]
MTALPEAGTELSGRFPPDFIWGAGSSAYQIEGATTEDGRGPSVWDTFCAVPGKINDGDTGEPGADHYHRLEEDLELMSSLGLGGYRFSVAWPRIQPEGVGKVNQKGLDFYRRLVAGLLERGIRPMTTLFHWDLPQALQDIGGWENRDVAGRFADYAALVADALDVADWVTINEPRTVVDAGHVLGIHAPGIADESRAYVVAHHLLLGHGLAVQALRAGGPGRRVGIALDLHPTYPADDTPEAAAAAWRQDGADNRLYLDPVLLGGYPADVLEWVAERSPVIGHIRAGDLATISEPIDLLGVQYYTPAFLDGEGQRIYRYPRAQAVWLEDHPEAFYDVLMRLARDYPPVPIVVTENGIATDEGPDDDPVRLRYLQGHLRALSRAIADGAPVAGYHAWSLLDNFEWAEGYRQRFGLVHVDFATQKRTLKASGRWYRDVIRHNRLL